MTKEQFFEELESCLAGEVSSYELADSLAYYRQYVAEAMQQGKSEQAVIDSLGSPRLIAKSIIDARGTGNDAETSRDTYAYSDARNVYDEISESEQEGGTLQKIGRKIVGVALVCAVVLVLFFLMQALIPVVLVCAAVWFVLKLIRGE